MVPISTGGTFTSGTSQSALLLNRQYEVNDVLSAVRGRHQLRFGGDVIVAHSGGNSKEFGGPIYLGQFIYNTCTQALAVCESPAYLGNIANVRSYTQSYGNAHYTVTDTLWSLFAQDDIRVRQDLTVNLGLRYERQTFTDSAPRASRRALGFAYNCARRGHDRDARRVRHLLFADRGQRGGQLGAHRSHGRLQLHRFAGPDRFPGQRGRGAAAGVSGGRAGARYAACTSGPDDRANHRPVSSRPAR